MILPILIGLFAAEGATASSAVSISYGQLRQLEVAILQLDDAEGVKVYNQLNIPLDSVSPVKHKKLKAVLLGIFLGHFGVHRIYLGTKANVPVAYSLTLGGGFGLLPLIDVIALLTTPDISRYENNNKLIMWMK
jgi:TM2 domain-containing membrane protein YozV